MPPMRLLRLDSNGVMRLINVVSNETPPFAILSHTWGPDEDEVTFDDLENSSAQSKPGYAKLWFCMNQAHKDGLDHIWVDTCCINKRSDAELSAAIASMFRWYRNAAKCYVYLVDVSVDAETECPPQHVWESQFRRARWFKRGWTLQELLAPASVEFFTIEGLLLGNKRMHEALVGEITGIPTVAFHSADLSKFSISERLRWAENRETKEIEDKAYCLLGIFGVFLPLIYGEQQNAFKRLLVEIKRTSASMQRRTNAHWLVSRSPNPLFTGRGDVLDELCSVIGDNLASSSGQGQCRIVIHGIGGQGKSELCLQLANRLRERFWAVFWIDVSSSFRAEKSLLNLVRRLSIPAASWEEACLVIANLQQNWLLVLDNADDPNVDYLQYIPSGLSGVVIITSRNVECQQYATASSILLTGLSIVDARELLLKAARIPHEHRDRVQPDADKIAKLLDSHPLALIQAAAYISCHYCTLAKYPEVYHSQRQRLLTFRPRQAQSRYGDVYATFEASAEAIQSSTLEGGSNALQLLSLLAVCGPYRVPMILFEVGWKGAKLVVEHGFNAADKHDPLSLSKWHADRIPPILRSIKGGWDDFSIKQALQILMEFSLVTTDSVADQMTVSMHPLVHVWARDRESEAMQQEAWLQMACLVGTAVNCAGNQFLHDHHFIPHLEALSTRGIDKVIATEPPDMVLRILEICGWLLYLMSGPNQLSRWLRKIFSYLSLDLQPTNIDCRFHDLYELLARSLVDCGTASHALPIFEQLTSSRGSLSRQNVLGSSSLFHELGRAYLGDGQTQKAIATLEDEVARQNERLSLDNPNRLASVELSRAYQADGKFQEAIELLEQVVAIDAQTLDETDPARLQSLHTLASAYMADSQHDKAINHLEAINTIQEMSMDETHPQRLGTQHELARVYEAVGRITDSLRLLETVVKMKKQNLTEAHPDLLASQHHLGLAYLDSGREDEAVRILEHVAEQRNIHLRVEHPDRLATQTALANAYEASGRISDAITLLEEVVDIEQRSLHYAHPGLMASQHALAQAYQSAGDTDKALVIFQKIVEIEEQSMPKGHAGKVATLQSLAICYWYNGDHQSAHEIMASVLASYSQIQNTSFDVSMQRNAEDWMQVFDERLGAVSSATLLQSTL